MKNLSEKSILVNLRISVWQARKYDKKITEEVNRTHKANDAGRFNKILIAKEHLEEVSKIAGKMRAYHYDNTLPWNDNGERLLSVENFFEYGAKMSELQDEFNTAAQKFIAAYPAIIEDARQRLNGLFNANDYPAFIDSKFECKKLFLPVPESKDVRVNLSDAEVSAIKAELENEINSRFANAQRDIYTRVIEHLRAMYERLSEKDAIFRDSLFENVRALVDLLPRLNIANDPGITNLCDELRALYCDPENVRKDKNLRAQKAKEVDAMLSKLNAFL